MPGGAFGTRQMSMPGQWKTFRSVTMTQERCSSSPRYFLTRSEISIPSDGGVVTATMIAQWRIFLPHSSRRSYHPGELPEHLKAAIKDAKMAPEHDHLNALLDD